MTEKMISKEQKKVHLYKPFGLGMRSREVTEEWADPMSDVTEADLDSDNNIVKGVCIFGKKESDNGYTYSDKAVKTLTTLLEGTKSFINHPSKEEIKNRDGVRDLRDWAGIYTNARQDGSKVFGDLYVRESYWDLVSDIALMKPAKVGNSINSRVKVYVDEAGKESIVDIDKLHSVDLVASGATIDNLWESTDEKLNEEEQEAKEQFLSILEEHFPNLAEDIREGILSDKIKQDEIRSKANTLLWKASDIIFDTLRDKEIKTFSERRKKVVGVLDDLEKEMAKIMPKIKPDKTTKDSIVVSIPTIVIPDN